VGDRERERESERDEKEREREQMEKEERKRKRNRKQEYRVYTGLNLEKRIGIRIAELVVALVEWDETENTTWDNKCETK
jgi:hypothetical protein